MNTRIKHNDLTHWFIRDHNQLPVNYVKSCNKFFRELSVKRQASSLHKPGRRVKNRFKRKI
jgi:hypothetical protein